MFCVFSHCDLTTYNVLSILKVNNVFFLFEISDIFHYTLQEHEILCWATPRHFGRSMQRPVNSQW